MSITKTGQAPGRWPQRITKTRKYENTKKTWTAKSSLSLSDWPISYFRVFVMDFGLRFRDSATGACAQRRITVRDGVIAQDEHN
jgi:hypothetical protein